MAERSEGTVPAALWRRRREPSDGLVIGVACGAGFAALETMGYATFEPGGTAPARGSGQLHGQPLGARLPGWR
jgi:RsiW-degrading membrane proteinase PrsW (M82 family)